MTGNLILIVVVATALAFDFTNGFHDTANAMATTIATGALSPRVAVGLAAVLNVVGAFLSIQVAATIAKGIVDAQAVTLPIIFAGLLGGITWNLATWYFGLPSSSSHALIGGILGATIVAVGTDAIKGTAIISKVLVPAVFSPLIAGGVAVIGTIVAYRLTQRTHEGSRKRGFRVGQIASSSMVSLAHGTNDAQKTMGVITLALITNGSISPDSDPPTWVILAAATAIGLGTYVGGWRVIATLGHRITAIEPPQGFAAQSASATVILAASQVGFPLSTTHVCSGGIIGSGVGRRYATVDWGVAGQMVAAWVLTLPMAALVGGSAVWLANDAIGGTAGIIVVGAIALLGAFAVWAASRRRPIGAAAVGATTSIDAGATALA